MNPLITVDDWAVLSDGTIAFVRGHDYHIDWIHTDGSKVSTGKLPFDWKRLTDDDKQKLIDSARTAADKAAADAKANAGKPGAASAEAAGMERMAAALGGGGGAGGGGGFAGFGGARAMPVETGDYRVIIDAGGQMMSQTLRVVRVAPGETSVLVPAKR